MCGTAFTKDDPVTRAFSWSVLFLIAMPYTIFGVGRGLAVSRPSPPRRPAAWRRHRPADHAQCSGAGHRTRGELSVSTAAAITEHHLHRARRVAAHPRELGQARHVDLPRRRRHDLRRAPRGIRRAALRRSQLAAAVDDPRHPADRLHDLPAHLQQRHDGRGARGHPAGQAWASSVSSSSSPSSGGAMFLAMQAYEWTHLIEHGQSIRRNNFGATFFILTGFHGMHVFSGVVYLSIILLDRLRRTIHARATTPRSRSPACTGTSSTWSGSSSSRSCT